MSRGFRRFRNFPARFALFVLVKIVIPSPAGPSALAAGRAVVRPLSFLGRFPAPRYVGSAHPATCELRLLNISFRRKSAVPIAGQTGFEPRRVVEWRLQRTPEAGGDQSFPFRNRLDSPRFAGAEEPSGACRDVPDFVAINALQNGGRALVAGCSEAVDGGRCDVEPA